MTTKSPLLIRVFLLLSHLSPSPFRKQKRSPILLREKKSRQYASGPPNFQKLVSEGRDRRATFFGSAPTLQARTSIPCRVQRPRTFEPSRVPGAWFTCHSATGDWFRQEPPMVHRGLVVGGLTTLRASRTTARFVRQEWGRDFPNARVRSGSSARGPVASSVRTRDRSAPRSQRALALVILVPAALLP